MSGDGDGAEGLHRALRGAAPPWYDGGRDTWQRVEVPGDDTRAWDLPGVQIPAAGLAWILLALLLAAAVVVVLRLLRHRLPRSGTGRAPAATAAATARLSRLPLGVAAEDPDQALAAAVAAQDWGRALLWLYARALLRLEGAGALRLEPGLGDAACRRRVRAWAGEAPGRGPVAAALDELGAAYLAVRFGHQPCPGERFAALAAADAQAAARLAREAAP